MAEEVNTLGAGWEVRETQNGKRHVVPVSDTRMHLPQDCWCGPTQDAEDPDLFVHHSADERESYEQGRSTN